MDGYQYRYQQYLKQARLFRAKVHSLAKAGHSQTNIGKHLGVSRQRINQILNATAHSARLAVKLAVMLKTMPKASTLKCVDCGVQATQYDHRDYAKRLSVEPVCARCNKRRGDGLNGGRFARPPARKLTTARINKMKMRVEKIATMGGWAQAVKRKSKLKSYAKRRTKILKLAKTLRQADIARLLGMTPQRVQQIVKAGSGG